MKLGLAILSMNSCFAGVLEDELLCSTVLSQHRAIKVQTVELACLKLCTVQLFELFFIYVFFCNIHSSHFIHSKCFICFVCLFVLYLFSNAEC